MNTRTRLTIILIAAAKLLILLYINLTSQMQFVSHLVLMPLLLLESLAICGYLLEFPPKAVKKAVVRIQPDSHKTNHSFRVKSAA